MSAPYPVRADPLAARSGDPKGIWVSGLSDDTDTGVRAEATFQALSELEEHSRDIPGRKTDLSGFTCVVPNWVDYPYGCHDVTFTEGSGCDLAGECSGNCRRLCWPSTVYGPFVPRFFNGLDRTGTSIYSVKENEGRFVPLLPDRGTAQYTLHLFAHLTGALMFSDGLTEKAIVQSLEKSPAPYQLGFEMPSPDGKYHKLRRGLCLQGCQNRKPARLFRGSTVVEKSLFMPSTYQ